RETEAREKADYEQECHRMCAVLVRQAEQLGMTARFPDLLLKSAHDLDLLHQLQRMLDNFEAQVGKTPASKPQALEKFQAPKANRRPAKKPDPEVAEPQGA